MYTHVYKIYVFWIRIYQAVGPEFSKDEQGQDLELQEGQVAKI